MPQGGCFGAKLLEKCALITVDQQNQFIGKHALFPLIQILMANFFCSPKILSPQGAALPMVVYYSNQFHHFDHELD